MERDYWQEIGEMTEAYWFRNALTGEVVSVPK